MGGVDNGTPTNTRRLSRQDLDEYIRKYGIITLLEDAIAIARDADLESARAGDSASGAWVDFTQTLEELLARIKWLRGKYK